MFVRISLAEIQVFEINLEYEILRKIIFKIKFLATHITNILHITYYKQNIFMGRNLQYSLYCLYQMLEVIMKMYCGMDEDLFFFFNLFFQITPETH